MLRLPLLLFFLHYIHTTLGASHAVIPAPTNRCTKTSCTHTLVKDTLELTWQYVNVKNINANLYTRGVPDPDILIRTGDTKRISNFLLWQIAYTEIFFEKKLWPDFNKKDYRKIIKNFKTIKRNFGAI